MESYKIDLNGEFLLDDWAWGGAGEITPSKFKSDLKTANGKNIEVDLNSIGGHVDASVDMFLAGDDYKMMFPNAIMTLNIKGQAASAASLFASGKFWDKVTVTAISTAMYHNPSGFGIGDYREFEKTGKELRRMRDMYASVYASRSKMDIEEIKIKMDDTLYLYGQEIVDAGFADELVGPTYDDQDKTKAVAKLDLDYKNSMKKIEELEKKYGNQPNVAKDEKYNKIMKIDVRPQQPKNPASGGDNNSREEKIMDVKDVDELQKEHPEIHSAVMKAGEEKGATDERARVDEIRKIMKDESFSWCKDAMTICDEAITSGMSAFDCKMKVNAEIAKMMSDPSKRNQMLSDLDSPGAIGGQGGDDGELKDKDERFQPGKF